MSSITGGSGMLTEQVKTGVFGGIGTAICTVCEVQS